MIVVALIVLVIIIGLLWYFTMGRKQAAPPEDATGMEVPGMMEGEGTGATGQPAGGAAGPP